MLPYMPSEEFVSEVEDEEQLSNQTFAINTTNSTIGGMTDDLSALKQSIYLLLSVEADQYIIYPYTYGITTVDLIGKPDYYVIALLPERIKDALMYDDRITDVTDFDFEVDRNKINVNFVVHTIYGNTKEETVVMY